MNYSLLRSLAYIFPEEQWLRGNIMLVHWASKHTSKGICLHMNYFILQTTTIHIQKLHITAILDYSTNLNQKPLVIRELVDAIKNILCSAEQQQHIIMAKHQWSKGKKGQLLEVGQAAGVWQS